MKSNFYTRCIQSIVHLVVIKNMSRNKSNNTIPGYLLHYHFHDHLAELSVSHILYYLWIDVSLYNFASIHRLPFSFRFIFLYPSPLFYCCFYLFLLFLQRKLSFPAYLSVLLICLIVA